MHIPETSMLLSGSARCRLAVSDIGGPRTLAEMQAAHLERRRREAMVTSPPCTPIQAKAVQRPPTPIVAPSPIHSLRAAAAWERRKAARTGKYPAVHAIVASVAEAWGVTETDVLSARRTSKVVRPRQVAMFLAKELTLRSLPDIGRRIGGRDHTTVLHGVRRIGELIETDGELAEKIAGLRAQLEARLP